MKKYTLAKPQGPEPHRSRESISFFKKDGTPVDLGSIFESDGDLSLSMLATDQVIGWIDGPSITPREGGGLNLDETLYVGNDNAYVSTDDAGSYANDLALNTYFGFSPDGIYYGNPLMDGSLTVRDAGGFDLTGGRMTAPQFEVPSLVDDTYIEVEPSVGFIVGNLTSGYSAQIHAGDPEVPGYGIGASLPSSYTWMYPEGGFESRLETFGRDIAVLRATDQIASEANLFLREGGGFDLTGGPLALDWGGPDENYIHFDGNPADDAYGAGASIGWGLGEGGWGFTVVGRPGFAAGTDLYVRDPDGGSYGEIYAYGDGAYVDLRNDYNPEDTSTYRNGYLSHEQMYFRDVNSWVYGWRGSVNGLTLFGTTTEERVIFKPEANGVKIDKALGLFGHTPPAAQPATPADLPGVIQVLKDYGLVAS